MVPPRMVEAWMKRPPETHLELTPVTVTTRCYLLEQLRTAGPITRPYILERLYLGEKPKRTYRHKADRAERMAQNWALSLSKGLAWCIVDAARDEGKR